MSMISVNGSEIPNPKTMQWGLMDISDKDTGRTMDAKMHKNRVAQKRKLELSWPAVDASTASLILNAFNDETFDVTYFDAMEGGQATRTFYCGNRTAPVLMWVEDFPGSGQRHLYESIRFDIIEV